MSDIFDTVTVQQFQEMYSGDFYFIATYEEGQTYAENQIVYSTPNFYKSLQGNNTEPLTNNEYWELVPFNNMYVTEGDITKAMLQAKVAINKRFGDTDEEKIFIFLHLVAFYLVLDKQNSAMGANSSFNGIVASKSVGDVSESYSIPSWLQNNPLYSIYAQNGYGLKYLSLIVPYLANTIRIFRGRSTLG